MKVVVLVPKPFDDDVREAIDDYKRYIERPFSQHERRIERGYNNTRRRKELIEFMYTYDLSNTQMDKSHLVEIEVEL